MEEIYVFGGILLFRGHVTRKQEVGQYLENGKI